MTQQELNTYQKGTDWKEIVMPWIYSLAVGVVVGLMFLEMIK